MQANLPIEGPIYQQPVQVSRRVVDYEIGEEENAENKYRMAWGNVIEVIKTMKSYCDASIK